MEEITLSELINFLEELDRQSLLTNPVKQDIWDKCVFTQYETQLVSYLNKSNINEKTFDDGSAPKQIIDVLIKNQNASNFINWIQSNPTLNNFPKRGNFNKLISYLDDLVLRELLQIEGREGGRGVGKGEVFLASLFNDVSMMVDGKGDLSWGGSYLEVKGTSARLGGRDRLYTNFEHSKLGILAIQHNIITNDIGNIITELSNHITETVLLDAIEEFSDYSYPHHTKSYINDISILDNDIIIRQYLTKIYFSNYINNEGVEYMIFINTKKNSPKVGSNYVLFKISEMPQLIDQNIIGCGRIKSDDLDPCIQAPKV